MSLDLTKRVWKDKRATGSARVLLLALADMAREKTDDTCWPSIETLREMVNVDTDRAVRRLLSELEALGCIVRISRPGHSNLYRITPDETVRTDETVLLNNSSPHPGRICPDTPDESVRIPRTDSSSITISEPLLNHNRTIATAPQPSSTDSGTASPAPDWKVKRDAEDALIAARLLLNPEWEAVATEKSAGAHNKKAYQRTILLAWENGDPGAPTPKKEPAPPRSAPPPLPEVFQGCLGEGIGDETVRIYLRQAMARLSQDGIWSKEESIKNPEHCQMAINIAQHDFMLSDPRARNLTPTHPSTGVPQ